MKYNHTNRISLPCYEFAFRTWLPPDTHTPRLYRVTVNKNIQTQRISHKNEYLVLNF